MFKHRFVDSLKDEISKEKYNDKLCSDICASVDGESVFRNLVSQYRSVGVSQLVILMKYATLFLEKLGLKSVDAMIRLFTFTSHFYG
jgi:hypothetical protein